MLKKSSLSAKIAFLSGNFCFAGFRQFLEVLFVLEFLNSFWPWYIGGPLLGLTVPLLVLTTGRQLGISLCFKPPLSILFGKKIQYFNYDWSADLWRVVFVTGILIGGFLGMQIFGYAGGAGVSNATVQDLAAIGVTDFSHFLPFDLFGIDKVTDPSIILYLVSGGFLVGFGARYANGCTSGHAIMGISYFQVASMIATASFFVGGMIMTHLIFPYVMEALLK